MEPTGKTYDLESFQDVLDKVPAERIQACMSELGGQLQRVAMALGLLGCSLNLYWPIKWTDDGLDEEATLRFAVGGKPPFGELKIHQGGEVDATVHGSAPDTESGGDGGDPAND